MTVNNAYPGRSHFIQLAGIFAGRDHLNEHSREERIALQNFADAFAAADFIEHFRPELFVVVV
jgi:hypothetical protein